VGPDGQVMFDLVAEIVQRRSVKSRDGRRGFDFYGGATAILDPRGRVRYVIRKSVLDGERLRRQRDFIGGDGRSFFGNGPGNAMLPEPKMLLRLHDATRPKFFSTPARRIATRELPVGGAAQKAFFLLRRGSEGAAVTLLKACLNEWVARSRSLSPAPAPAPAPALDDTPFFDAATEQAVSRLQFSAGITVDGIVGPATWAMIGRELRERGANVVSGLGPASGVEPASGLGRAADVPPWIRHLLINDAATASLREIDVASATALYEFGYGMLSPSGLEGLTFLMKSIAADEAVTDLRWGAYMLATVKHECADTWQPIEEFGKGAGRTYGRPEIVVDRQGGQHQNRYYGRGYVQLTWKDNYLALGRAIGQGDALLIQPELALTPAVAYRVMSIGMRQGLFTGKKLASYIAAGRADYVGARRIINGTDQAQRIAGYARQLETVLLASVRGEGI
jgi:hypothetical protein